ncbi:hypothetical protein QE152_g22719 [Popillia japonica]|uniref:Regulatory protein zeste n=1 Tax=Popillia japonica TaxID=7064 RepID=A0AAW1KJT3_POPJA
MWSHKGKPTSVDHNAAELLLELRQQKETKFKDKKTSKIQLWQQIAGELNNQDYNIEPSKEGGEKCQKFQNFSRNYIKFVRFVNTTGNEKKQPPEHYDKLHEILGNKDKITVGNISDSLDMDILDNEASTSSMPNESSEESNSTEHVTSKGNRFNKVKKSTRPPKSDVVTVLKEFHETNVNMQKEQFANETNVNMQKEQFAMVNNILKEQNSLLEIQNQQRNQLIEIF